MAGSPSTRVVSQRSMRPGRPPGPGSCNRGGQVFRDDVRVDDDLEVATQRGRVMIAEYQVITPSASNRRTRRRLGAGVRSLTDLCGSPDVAGTLPIRLTATSSKAAPSAGASGEGPPVAASAGDGEAVADADAVGVGVGIAGAAFGVPTCLGGETDIDPGLVVAQRDGRMWGIRVGGPGKGVVAVSQLGQVRPGVVVELRLQRARWRRRWGTFITFAAGTPAARKGGMTPTM